MLLIIAIGDDYEVLKYSIFFAWAGLLPEQYSNGDENKLKLLNRYREPSDFNKTHTILAIASIKVVCMVAF